MLFATTRTWKTITNGERIVTTVITIIGTTTAVIPTIAMVPEVGTHRHGIIQQLAIIATEILDGQTRPEEMVLQPAKERDHDATGAMSTDIPPVIAHKQKPNCHIANSAGPNTPTINTSSQDQTPNQPWWQVSPSQSWPTHHWLTILHT